MFKTPLNLFSGTAADAFYQACANARLSDLLLKYAHDDLHRELSLQLDARKKAQKKVPTWVSTPGIVFPLPQFLEQASSEATANYKATLFDYVTSADLTGGTGIDSWQFALRAKKHHYTEPNPALANLAKHNFNVLGLKNISIINAGAEDFLKTIQEPVDLIYLDPSRRVAQKRVVNLEEYNPNVPVLLSQLLEKCQNLLIKVSPLADISYLQRIFEPHVIAIHSIAVGNECKELLVQCTSVANQKPDLVAVNLSGATRQTFRFTANDEKAKAIVAEKPLAYLYEPNAAVLKAGAFNAVAIAFRLQKLHPNTHLYTSNELEGDFPGRIFCIEETCKPFKMSGVFEPLNVAVRNYPEKAEVIQKKLSVKQGADYRLFATTVKQGKVFIIGKEVAE